MNRVTESTLLVHLFCLALLVLLRSIIIPMFYGRYMETIFRRLPVAGSTSTDDAVRGLINMRFLPENSFRKLAFPYIYEKSF